MATALKTPVALLIFNRPECTREVFLRVREARPRQLLIVADGPRANRPADAELCRATRAVVEDVDWPCEVRRRYSEENLGCGRGVSSGLDWVFSQVEEAIILEDDCLPDPTFFGYCEELLARYRADDRVMSISGDNFLAETEHAVNSYRFSRVPHIWGWATWRRAWKGYDFEMKAWPQFRDEGGIKRLFGPYPAMRAQWTEWLNKAHQGHIDTWDFQWCFASFLRSGVHILPRRNLVTNIGFSASATHTVDPSAAQANLAVHRADQPLRHPDAVAADARADYQTFVTTMYNGGNSLTARLRRKLAAILKRGRGMLAGTAPAKAPRRLPPESL